MHLAARRVENEVVIESSSVIQADFDRIALLSQDHWGHNSHYHHLLLRYIPPCRNALEIGCGTGAFARLLAQRVEHVLALDLSPQMARVAKDRSQQHPNIEFLVADVAAWRFPVDHFDCVATIATLHHLQLDIILEQIATSLKVGGVLVVLDLFRVVAWTELLAAQFALPADIIMRLTHNGVLREPQAIRDAWTEHGRHDHYLNLAEIRAIADRVLPGARVRRHWFWRYSLLWRKTAAHQPLAAR